MVVVVKKGEPDDAPTPNIIYTYPVFHLIGDPENKFAVFDIFWAKEYERLGDVSDVDQINIEQAVEAASELVKHGLVLVTGEYYTIRDENQELAVSILTHNEFDPIHIFLVAGPRHDQRLVEHKKVSIN